jgi:ATP-binding cassette, subfamily F, member 3
VVRKGSRVAIVGVNGAGKTTLLKLLSGKLAATEGEVRLGHEVKVGYYAQLQAESLNLQKTILQELEETAPEMPVSQVRAIAGAFLFSGDSVQKKCGVLSGGEKARVALAKLLLSPSNFLILDEPTNHLDADSREVLLQALQDYQGTLCLVSHDRAFVSPLVDSVLEIKPQTHSAGLGADVVQLLGTYDEYLARKEKEMAEAARESRKGEGKKKVSELVVPDRNPERTQPSHNQKKSWDSERQKLEAGICKLEARQSECSTG